MTALVNQSALWTGLASVAQECVVLLVFFATWSITRSYSQTKAVDPEKRQNQKTKETKDPVAIAQVIQQLCTDQFTRALRMYRDLVKKDLDKVIVEESFYTAMIEAAVRVGKSDVATEIIQRMVTNGLEPSSAFLLSLFKMLAARKLYSECVNAYSTFGVGHSPDPIVYSCLVLAASEATDVSLARRIVDQQQMGSREALPLVRAYVRTGDWQAAVSLVQSFLTRGVIVENIVLNTALAACSKFAAAVPAMQNLLDEVATFEETSKSSILDIVSYNTLMKAHAKNRDVKACFALLDIIMKRSAPDGVTFSTLLDVCVQQDEHDLVSVALERMTSSGVEMTCVLMTTLMKGFVRSQRLDKALELYCTMKAGNVKPDMITYSLLIKACCDQGQMEKALQVLEDLLQSGCTVDDIVFTHLIDGCCQVSNVLLAEQLFRDMIKAKIKPTVYTLTGLVKVYGKCGMSEKAMAFVASMEQSYGVAPTVVVYTCVVSGLLRQKKYPEAYTCFQQMMERCELDTHCVQTMLYGLGEGMMWSQYNDVAAQFLARGVPPLSPECLNHALLQMADKGSAQSARVLHGMMQKYGVEVQEPVRQKLQ